VGALAVGVGLVLRLQGMAHWIMWELSSLFESIGVIYDGMDMLSKTQTIVDSDSAIDLPVPTGRIQIEEVRFHYGKDNNIAYGRTQASLDDVIAAATRANAHEFILDLEDGKGRRGYDAHVGERGVKLSGGQRQRLAIARMFLKDAPILILDEATSALDSEVEAAIQENLSALMQGKTVIAIAHRLSTIAAMDRLIVMDAGAVVQQGQHQELANASGLYSQLWARQSGGFLDASGSVA